MRRASVCKALRILSSNSLVTGHGLRQFFSLSRTKIVRRLKPSLITSLCSFVFIQDGVQQPTRLKKGLWMVMVPPLRVCSSKSGMSQMSVKKPTMDWFTCLPPRNCSNSLMKAEACQYEMSLPKRVHSTLFAAIRSIRASRVEDSGASLTCSIVRKIFLPMSIAVDLRVAGSPTNTM